MGGRGQGSLVKGSQGRETGITAPKNEERDIVPRCSLVQAQKPPPSSGRGYTNLDLFAHFTETSHGQNETLIDIQGEWSHRLLL